MDINEKVIRYETFLNEVLKIDLQNVLEQRDKVYQQQAEYLQLKTVIERTQEADVKELKTRVDLGSNFYVQAKIPDTSHIYVQVGFGFFVEFTLAEAVRFINKKTARLEEISNELTKDASKIKANIKLVLEGLRELQAGGIHGLKAESVKPPVNLFD